MNKDLRGKRYLGLLRTSTVETQKSETTAFVQGRKMLLLDRIELESKQKRVVDDEA